MCDDQEKENNEIQKNVFEVIRNHILCDNPLATAFCINIVDEWLSCYSDCVYLGCENNKVDDALVSLYHNNTIYLLGDAYKTIMYAPKLMFHFVTPQHIHIDDVLMKHNNVGNGSIVMRALIKYAKLNSITTITGSLSSVDDDHKTRRDHYYKKFGFEVRDDSIIKNI
jgi:hypothetical protein